MEGNILFYIQNTAFCYICLLCFLQFFTVIIVWGKWCGENGKKEGGGEAEILIPKKLSWKIIIIIKNAKEKAISKQ